MHPVVVENAKFGLELRPHWPYPGRPGIFLVPTIETPAMLEPQLGTPNIRYLTVEDDREISDDLLRLRLGLSQRKQRS